jgi:hypothetical protein
MFSVLVALLLAILGAHAPQAPHYAPLRPTVVEAPAPGVVDDPCLPGDPSCAPAAPAPIPEAPAPAAGSLPDAPEPVGPATDSPMCFDHWQGLMPATQLCWDPDTGEVRLPR